MCAKCWHKARLVAEILRNERAFPVALTEFSDQPVADVALKVFKTCRACDIRPRPRRETKSRMQKNLLLLGLKRFDRKLLVTAITLYSYCTEKTANVFDALLDNGKKMAARSFLLKEASQWPGDAS
ncbi:hypothetical protein PR048_024476 [Dryococelus australis]|uniref:Uncharacterized protein n=1 Tax=Dryococelus australis TaxID=614101 RepID=A0ABQ9GNQ8_9NEOP|nr:hypothetical protein PR048_024476 [Dryococelus australis]